MLVACESIQVLIRNEYFLGGIYSEIQFTLDQMRAARANIRDHITD